MIGLKVETWQQWEELTCYLLRQFVFENTNVQVDFQTYGSRGQNQFGIDLIPSFPQQGKLAGVVGQSKLKETTLTWNDILTELKKTDSYKNSISCYVLFTTANAHTTIQDVINATPYYYTRPDGTKFRVLVKYFHEYSDLSFVPHPVLTRLFPAAFSITQYNNNNQTEYLSSIQEMKKHVPNWLGNDSINWLDTWDFSCGFVKQEDFTKFENLFLEYDRTVTALDSKLYNWLKVGDRQLITKCLPAASTFFDALTQFRQSISNNIIGKTSLDFGSIYTIEDLPLPFQSHIVHDWQSKAQYLSYIYKKDILGMTAE